MWGEHSSCSVPGSARAGGAGGIGCCGVGERGDQGCPKVICPSHCVNGVTISKMGKMEGEQVWGWALDIHVEICQGQVDVGVCSWRRGWEQKCKAESLVAGRDSKAPGNECRHRREEVSAPELLRWVFSRSSWVIYSSPMREQTRKKPMWKSSSGKEREEIPEGSQVCVGGRPTYHVTRSHWIKGNGPGWVHHHAD